MILPREHVHTIHKKEKKKSKQNCLRQLRVVLKYKLSEKKKKNIFNSSIIRKKFLNRARVKINVPLESYLKQTTFSP